MSLQTRVTQLIISDIVAQHYTLCPDQTFSLSILISSSASLSPSASTSLHIEPVITTTPTCSPSSPQVFSTRVTTAMCCLDREKTQSYAIQVVATDGGGLKGTGTVVVNVGDANDVRPRFSRSDWEFEVHETSPVKTPLERLSVLDADVSNEFHFRVVPESGFGWDRFRVMPMEDESGQGALEVLQPLDFEDPEQKGGFRFKVQVSDKDTAWTSGSHTDTTWVSVSLLDDNDNAPEVPTPFVNLTLKEDLTLGHTLASFSAYDRDKDGTGRIHYSIDPVTDPTRRFTVDSHGRVRLRRRLDRETSTEHSLHVLVVDDGQPPLTATATLSITLTDVNDNAPHITSPVRVSVKENQGPQHVAEVHLGDHDDWSLGHGPPFVITLDDMTSGSVRDDFAVDFDARGDSGRGIAVISTLGPLDREQGPLRFLPLVLEDAGNMRTTSTLTVIVGDENDNDMKPGTKNITVSRLEQQRSPIPLGRIYVTDPDDWDVGSKHWTWRRGSAVATLLPEEKEGRNIKDRVEMYGRSRPVCGPCFCWRRRQENSPSYRKPGMARRYHLEFSVTDSERNQHDIRAEVYINVKSISGDELNERTTIPLEVTSHSSRELLAGDEKHSSSTPLARLLSALQAALKEELDLVAVEGDLQEEEEEKGVMEEESRRRSRIWIKEKVQREVGNPIVQMILLKQQVVEKESGVSLGAIGLSQMDMRGKGRVNGGGRGSVIKEGGCGDDFIVLPLPKTTRLRPTATGRSCVDGCQLQLRPVTLRHYDNDPIVPGIDGLGLARVPESWLVDTNATALATPRLEAVPKCNCPTLPYPSLPLTTCTPNPCRNGGRCVPAHQGYRCVCPQGTTGKLCKILSRQFEDGGWAWLPPLPTCTHAHISLKMKTSNPAGPLLYQGPKFSAGVGSQVDTDQELEVFLLELHGGRPRLLLDLGSNPIVLTLPPTAPSLADDAWHRIDVVWGSQTVELVADMCEVSPKCHISAPLPPHARILNTPAPLQVGGLSHPPPYHHSFAWPIPVPAFSFEGCIKEVRVNGELYDLGPSVESHASHAGCQTDACRAVDCGLHGSCSISTTSVPTCECQPGWSGADCRLPTVPASFKPHSYVKASLSFSPPLHTTALQLRFRTWEPSGQLLVVTSQHGRDQLVLYLFEGHLCLHLTLRPDPAHYLCLTKVLLNDGKWHLVKANRYGGWLELSADEGDGAAYNVSLRSARGGAAAALGVDKLEGVHIGGTPEYVGVSVFKVHHDFQFGCIDDVRLAGHSLPLPPVTNRTDWAQATMFRNVQRTCVSTSACVNVSCPSPFSCVDTWRSYECGCPEGQSLSEDRISCRDRDECVWAPCLHGGSCVNKDPGYSCVCPEGFIGPHCQLSTRDESTFSLSMGAVAAIIIWCAFLLLVIVAYVVHQHYRHRAALRKNLGDIREDILHYKQQQQQQHRSSSSPSSSPPPPLPPHMTLHGRQCPNHHLATTTTTITTITTTSTTTTPSSTVANVVELRVQQEPRANGRPAWSRKTNIADVDILKVEAASTSSGSVERCGCPHLPSIDDLRYYAYEGDASSPGSLSSCCSGAEAGGEPKLLGGFQEVAALLNCLSNDSQRPQASSSSQDQTIKDKVLPIPDVSQSAKECTRECTQITLENHSPILKTKGKCQVSKTGQHLEVPSVSKNIPLVVPPAPRPAERRLSQPRFTELGNPVCTSGLKDSRVGADGTQTIHYSLRRSGSPGSPSHRHTLFQCLANPPTCPKCRLDGGQQQRQMSSWNSLSSSSPQPARRETVVLTVPCKDAPISKNTNSKDPPLSGPSVSPSLDNPSLCTILNPTHLAISSASALNEPSLTQQPTSASSPSTSLTCRACKSAYPPEPQSTDLTSFSIATLPRRGYIQRPNPETASSTYTTSFGGGPVPRQPMSPRPPTPVRGRDSPRPSPTPTPHPTSPRRCGQGPGTAGGGVVRQEGMNTSSVPTYNIKTCKH
ncbi:putative neural-cadherin 2 [Oratosquilla oratoria]|uniref:putative neural-cadherin 2 n=1 Tax=Oratosquilla oratoria TaxID=337810 RepID=UPI003F7607B0